MNKYGFKLIILTVLMGACVHCGTGGNYDNIPQTYDKELEEFLSEFHEDRQIRGAPFDHHVTLWQARYVARDEKLPWGNSLRESGAIGLCMTSTAGFAYVYLDKALNQSPKIIRKMVAYHEYGHCVLGMGHYEEGNEFDIMNPQLPVDGSFEFLVSAMWDDLVDTMFARHLIESLEGETAFLAGQDRRVHVCKGGHNH